MTTFWLTALAGAGAGGVLFCLGFGWWSLAGFLPAGISAALGTAYSRAPIGRHERVVRFAGGQIATVYGLTPQPQEVARQWAADAMPEATAAERARKFNEKQRSARLRGLNGTQDLWTFDRLERYGIEARGVAVLVGPILTLEALYNVPGGQRVAVSVPVSATITLSWRWNAAWIWEIVERLGWSRRAVAWVEELFTKALLLAARMAMSQRSWVEIFSNPEQLALDIRAALRGAATLLCQEGILAENEAEAAYDLVLFVLTVTPGEIPTAITEDLTELRRTVAECDRRMQKFGVDTQEKQRDAQIAQVGPDREHERRVDLLTRQHGIDMVEAEQNSNLAIREHQAGLHRGWSGRRRRGRGGRGI